MVTAATPAATPALRWRTQFRTRSADEAVESVERLYGPHSLALRTRRELDMRLAGFDVGRLTVSSIEYGCAATAFTDIEHDYWVFSYCARGEIVVGKKLVHAGYAGVRTPHEKGDLPMSADLRLINIKVLHADLAEAAQTVFADAALPLPGFESLAAPGSTAALRLAHLMRRLNELPVCDTPYAPLLERRWQEAALLELLLSWPHTLSARLQRASAAPTAVDRAVDFMRNDPAAQLTLGEVARAAGVGVRALSRAFEKRLGTSPMRYLQQCRLERARADLLDARGGVTEVAYRWGFGNLGDFAARYRERFGELPSATLRRRA